MKEKILKLIKDKLEHIDQNVNPKRGGKLLVDRVDEIALKELYNEILKLEE